MKGVKTTLMVVLVLLVGMTSGSALAGGGHFRGHGHFGSHFGGHFRPHFGGHFWHPRVGVFIGAPLFWPWYAPAPYYNPYYYPPVVTVPSSPPVYIEQGSGQTAAQQPYYWYYCSSPEGYYPYVKDCPGGWRQVVPQPPPRP
jgi:hypothetical protein